MANFFENSEAVTDSEFQNFGALTRRQIPACLRLCRVDPSLHIRAVYPAAANRALVGVDTRISPIGYGTLLRAMRSREPEFSPPLQLLDGPRGILLAVPVFKGNHFEGEVVGAFRGSDFVSALMLPTVSERYEPLVLDSGQSLLSGPPPQAPPSTERPTVSETFPLAGASWEVRVSPRLEVVAERLHSGRAGSGPLARSSPSSPAAPSDRASTSRPAWPCA